MFILDKLPKCWSIYLTDIYTLKDHMVEHASNWTSVTRSEFDTLVCTFFDNQSYFIETQISKIQAELELLELVLSKKFLNNQVDKSRFLHAKEKYIELTYGIKRIFTYQHLITKAYKRLLERLDSIVGTNESNYFINYLKRLDYSFTISKQKKLLESIFESNEQVVLLFNETNSTLKTNEKNINSNLINYTYRDYLDQNGELKSTFENVTIESDYTKYNNIPLYDTLGLKPYSSYTEGLQKKDEPFIFNRKILDPKVFFSNERTFLQWIQTAFIISSMSIGLMTYLFSFGTEMYPTYVPTRANHYLGIVFFPFGPIFFIYALLMYYWRYWEFSKCNSNILMNSYWGPAISTILLIMMVISCYGVFLYDYYKSDHDDWNENNND